MAAIRTKGAASPRVDPFRDDEPTSCSHRALSGEEKAAVKAAAARERREEEADEEAAEPAQAEPEAGEAGETGEASSMGYEAVVPHEETQVMPHEEARLYAVVCMPHTHPPHLAHAARP